MKQKRKIEANSMTGYDDKGEIVMYHWQKEPYKVYRSVFLGLRLPWYKRFNPFWGNKAITFKEFKQSVKKKGGKKQ